MSAVCNRPQKELDLSGQLLTKDIVDSLAHQVAEHLGGIEREESGSLIVYLPDQKGSISFTFHDSDLLRGIDEAFGLSGTSLWGVRFSASKDVAVGAIILPLAVRFLCRRHEYSDLVEGKLKNFVEDIHRVVLFGKNFELEIQDNGTFSLKTT